MTTKPNDEGQSTSTVEPTVQTVGLGTGETAKAKAPGKSVAPAAKPRCTVKPAKRAPTAPASMPESSGTPPSTPTSPCCQAHRAQEAQGKSTGRAEWVSGRERRRMQAELRAPKERITIALQF